MIELLWLDGTWSRKGARSTVSEALRKALSGSDILFTYVDYPATFGPATDVGDMPYGESVAAGMASLRSAVRATPHVAMVGGYSQGAAAAVGFAREILPRSPGLDVRAVACLGNPHQPVHVGRGGIAGALDVPRRYVSIYAPGDPIADLPLGSPLRSVADLTEWMSIRSPEDGKRWAGDMFVEITRQKMQAWWKPWRTRDLTSAGQYALNYLGTCHTTDYLTGGHVQRMARTLVQLEAFA